MKRLLDIHGCRLENYMNGELRVSERDMSTGFV